MPDRIIRESICTSETLAVLTDFQERFWHRLTVNCDDYGRFDARPAILKGRLFPLMDDRTVRDMEEALRALADAGLIELYQVEGRPYLQLITWEKYQRVRAKRSKFPAKDGHLPSNDRHLPSNDSTCPRNPIQSNPNPNPNPYPYARTRQAAAVRRPRAVENKIRMERYLEELRGAVREEENST